MHCLEVIVARNNQAQYTYDRKQELKDDLLPEYDFSKLKRVPPERLAATRERQRVAVEKSLMMKRSYAAWSEPELCGSK